ncbi:hypothetical protein GDO86_002465 [Hymenochirus boettgeri]|uniref:FYN-binding protein 1 n=1 Tax=Hymenochirus boettgeri TaxID=247094 RepID=A0A8T2KIG7_9PIPI|nr:hypothetical protein GDO86_002465 [Hymenochirus boettgeri]
MAPTSGWAMIPDSNVKSLAAKFNSASCNMESTENSPAPPALKGIHAKMASFEKLSNSALGVTTPSGVNPKVPGTKPVFKPVNEEVKPSLSKSSVGVNKLAGSFHGVNKESNGKVPYLRTSGIRSPDLHKEEPREHPPKPLGMKPPICTNFTQEQKSEGFKSMLLQRKEHEDKPLFPKPPALKHVNSASESESKPTFPKKPLSAKTSGNFIPAPIETKKNAFVPHTYSSKIESKPLKQAKDPQETKAPASFVPQPISGVTLKSTTPKPIQSPFLKQDQEDQSSGSTKPNMAPKEFINKGNQNGSSGPAVNKFLKAQSTFPPSQGPSFQGNLKEPKDPLEPKRKPLPPPFKLGPPPTKPSRPPNVNLEPYKGSKGSGGIKGAHNDNRTSALSSALPPPPPAALIQGAPIPPGNPPAKQSSAPAPPPNLPPRNIRAPIDSTHTDDENYDDIIQEGNETYSRQQELKNEKEDKKRQEQLKKEQKEREKKEQELRKKFKLAGAIEVLHQAVACVDYKGGKNELTIKHGEKIEIIRITNNPEGKWLGRMNGNYGYIKTTMVIIDSDSLKRKKSTMQLPKRKEDNDPEIYDDVGEQDSVSKFSTTSDDIYEVEEDLTESLLAQIKTSSLGRNTDKDSKTLKRMEKEEKEFRKKFKFNNEIKVLSTTQVLFTLTTKKFGSKDLHIKPGETLDVIQQTNESTVLCRNTEGKYGYVLRNNLVEMDGEIYDDIGEGIYYNSEQIFL